MTLRKRIALLFMVLVALFLGVFSVIVYLKSSNLRSAEFFELLRERAEVAGWLVRDVGQMPAEARARMQRQLLNALPNEALAVYTASDSLLLEQATHRFRPTAFQLMRAHQDGIYMWEEGRRQFLLEVVGHSPYSIVVAVAAEDKLGYGQMENLSDALLWGSLSGVCLAGLVAWVMAGWGIRPVQNLTHQALQIQSPTERLLFPARNDELGKLSTAFNRLLERLEEAFDLQRAFIANASHELRTPIAVLMAQLHDLQLEAAASQKPHLAEMHTTLVRLAELIQHLLWMAHSAQTAENVPMEPVRIDEIAFEAVQNARKNWPGREIKFDLSDLTSIENEPVINGSPLLVQVAVANLIDNACKYATPGTAIDVVVKYGAMITLTVTDAGPGVQAQDLQKLKQPFFRSQHGSPSPGSGLGLALSDRIALLHGGSLELALSPQGGLQATLVFPVQS